MNTLAFAASNSANSINHALLNYLSEQVSGIELIRLTDYDSPMYGIDVEQSSGIPTPSQQLAEKIASADKLIISIAEHNGNLSAFFKNHIDWLSRHNREFLKGKSVLLLSASPGGAGGANALNVAKTMLPFFGATITETHSIASFYDVFQDGALKPEAAQTLLSKVSAFVD